MDTQYDYSSFDTLEDNRETKSIGKSYGDKEKNLYDSLINMVVNHKMELQKIPKCSSLAGAQEWAAKRKLRAGQQDFDGDGVPEIVVYNKAGQPMIINGYKPKASDYAIRKEYWTANPTVESRIMAGPMSEWVKEKAYEITPDPNNPWKRTIKKTEFGSRLKETGYKMPTKPKKQFSVFSIFCKLIAPYVREYFENLEDESSIKNLLGEDAGPSCVALLKKLISPISIYRMLYMKIVERYYFFHLHQGIPTMDTYKKFKEYIKNNPNKFWTFFKDNLLNDDLISFKENKVSIEVIAKLFVKDDIDWDGSDPDDAILFLMGIENVHDSAFSGTIRTEEHAGEALDELKSTNKTERRKAQKQLEKWKERARKGTKQFFKDQITYLMENGDAYNRFLAATEAGVNPIAPSPDVAAPSTPTRSVESRTAAEEEAPEEPPTTGQPAQPAPATGAPAPANDDPFLQ